MPAINNLGSGCRIRILSPPEEAGRHEVYDLYIAAGGALDSQPHARGAREHLTVIEGRISLRSGESAQVLNTSDTARYPADVNHCIAAHEGPARAFLVVHYA